MAGSRRVELPGLGRQAGRPGHPPKRGSRGMKMHNGLTPPAPTAAVQVVNLSELDPQWQWIGHRVADRFPGWRHVSSAAQPGQQRSGWANFVARAGAAVQAGQLVQAHAGPSVVVAHGPRPAQYFAQFGRRWGVPTHLMAFSFNFTVLPHGLRQRWLARAFQRVDSFIVASTTEQALYAHHFGLDPARLHMLPWGVRPPVEALAEAALEPGDYVCALGSQGRDYATLLDAMRRLPRLRLVLVATPDSLPAGPLPDNVVLRVNIPTAQAMNLLAHSRFMVLPMRDAEVPCGHVTVVSAMHLGRAVLATDTVGLHDYLRPEDNAVLVPPRDPVALARQMERLWAEPATCRRLGQAGQRFARLHCTEDAVVALFQRRMQALGLWPAAPRKGGR